MKKYLVLLAGFASASLSAQQLPSQLANLHYRPEGPHWHLVYGPDKKLHPEKFDFLEAHHSGLIAAKSKDKNHFFTLHKDSLIALPYEEVKATSGGVWLVKQGGFYGLISPQGQGLAFMDYEAMEDWGQGQFWVRRRGKEGILDAQGKHVLALKYEQVRRQSQGLVLGLEPNKFVFSRKEQFSEPFSAWQANPGHEMLAVSREERWGVLDLGSGQMLLEPKFEAVQILSSQHFAVKEGGVWKIHKKLQPWNGPAQAQNVLVWQQGFALQGEDQLWQLYDLEGKAQGPKAQAITQEAGVWNLKMEQAQHLYDLEFKMLHTWPLNANLTGQEGHYVLHSEAQKSEVLSLQSGKVRSFSFAKPLDSQLIWACEQESRCGFYSLAKDAFVLPPQYKEMLHEGPEGLYQVQDIQGKRLWWHSEKKEFVKL